MLIRCTAKLLREMGLGKVAPHAGASPPESELGEWYANLFYIERRKCVIFANAPTLFSIISFDVRRPEIRDLAGLFRKGLELELRDEQFSNEAVGRLLAEAGEIRFDRTADRRVLGAMVDQVKGAQYHAWYEGGLEKCDRGGIVKRLNRTPMSTIDFNYPIEEYSKALGEPKRAHDEDLRPLIFRA
jgi:hypothetical protein